MNEDWWAELSSIIASPTWFAELSQVLIAVGLGVFAFAAETRRARRLASEVALAERVRHAGALLHDAYLATSKLPTLDDLIGDSPPGTNEARRAVAEVDLAGLQRPRSARLSEGTLDEWDIYAAKWKMIRDLLLERFGRQEPDWEAEGRYRLGNGDVSPIRIHDLYVNYLEENHFRLLDVAQKWSRYEGRGALFWGKQIDDWDRILSPHIDVAEQERERERLREELIPVNGRDSA